LRDTNGTINRIYESIGGIFYSRSTDIGETFSNEQIVNNGGEADGNFNSFISEIKPHGDFNVDPVGNMVVVWQRREGNNEVIKFAYKSCTPSYSWSTFPDYYITVPSANSFNLQAKCFVQETASSSHNFFSLTAYLKPNGSNIDLMVTAKSSSSATPNNYVIESGNISEFAVTRSSQGIYQVLYFSFIKDNHVYFKCAKFFIYGSGVSYWSDPSNPDFTVSLNPDDGQILRISPDNS